MNCCHEKSLIIMYFMHFSEAASIQLLYETAHRTDIILLRIWKTSFEKNCVFCIGEYAAYGFDQLRLIWYVFRLWDMVFSCRFEH